MGWRVSIGKAYDPKRTGKRDPYGVCNCKSGQPECTERDKEEAHVIARCGCDMGSTVQGVCEGSTFAPSYLIADTLARRDCIGIDD
jgi:hypothetical protein